MGHKNTQSECPTIVYDAGGVYMNILWYIRLAQTKYNLQSKHMSVKCDYFVHVQPHYSVISLSCIPVAIRYREGGDCLTQPIKYIHILTPPPPPPPPPPHSHWGQKLKAHYSLWLYEEQRYSF